MSRDRRRRTSTRRHIGGAWALLFAATVIAPATACSHSAPTGAPAPADARIPIGFSLRHDSDGLARAAEEIADPNSERYRRWMTLPQIAHDFGAPEHVAANVERTLAAAGFVGGDDPTRGVLLGTMTVGDAAALLGTQFHVVDEGSGNVVQPDEQLRVPRSLRGYVTDVVGGTAQISASPASEPHADPSILEACPQEPVIFPGLREYYGIDSMIAAGDGGKGVTLGLLQTDLTSQAALSMLRRCFQAPIPPVTTIRVDDSPDAVFGPVAEESTLDILAASHFAPDLTGMTTYQFNPYSPIVFPLARAIVDGQTPGGPQIISTSVGFCEPQVAEADLRASEWYLAAAAATGITVVAASGDTGSSACAPADTAQAPQYPASSPFALAAGGSQILHGQLGAIQGEAVWNESPRALQAGGGATSSRLTRPAYQRGLDFPGGRLVPDLAFLAAPSTFGPIPVCAPDGGCRMSVVGGTSGTAPGVAAALADVSDAMSPGDTPPARLGLVNPTFYAVARDPSESGFFRDITVGNNDLYGVGCCTAVTGFDPASGWGSADFGRLLHRFQR